MHSWFNAAPLALDALQRKKLINDWQRHSITPTTSWLSRKNNGHALSETGNISRSSLLDENISRRRDPRIDPRETPRPTLALMLIARLVCGTCDVCASRHHGTPYSRRAARFLCGTCPVWATRKRPSSSRQNVSLPRPRSVPTTGHCYGIIGE